MNYKYNVGCSIENLKGVRDFIRGALKEHDDAELQISEMVLAARVLALTALDVCNLDQDA